MNVSGKTTIFAPFSAASAMNRQVFSTVASRSMKTGDAWTAAIWKVFWTMIVSLLALSLM
jgi:hypothetical protein